MAKGLAFEARFARDLPHLLRTDPLRLRRIVRSLVTNAIRYTDRGGVEIAVDYALGNLELTGCDTGRRYLPRVILRFSKRMDEAGASVSESWSGRELGLSSARRMARLMGGEVELVSSTPEQGSVFRITMRTEAIARPS